MQKLFHDQLRALGAEGKKILVAVSGGLDSTVLLDLLVKSTCELAVAHANFQLRAEESEGDEAWVRRLALGLKIPFYSKHFNTNNYATENGLSIQMAARELRYHWFDEILEQEKFDFLATGHHLNDNIETVLLNFTRGTGLDGLQGIPMKNGKTIRPLLTFSRKEIEEYATAQKLKWRDDSSNASDDYNRNFIRHHVFPKLMELNPSFEVTFARNMERLMAADELVSQALEQLKITHVFHQGSQVKILKSLLEMFQHPAPVLLTFIGGYGFNLGQCFEIVDAAQGQSGKLFLSPPYQLVVDREHLIISAQEHLWEEAYIDEDQRQAELGPWVLKIENSVVGKISPDRNQASLDQAKLKFPLLWRKWKPGDSFIPLGMDNKKKLSDFLIDLKVSLTAKDAVTVLESGGEIAWVVGWRIDDRFKVVEVTKRVYFFAVEGR